MAGNENEQQLIDQQLSNLDLLNGRLIQLSNDLHGNRSQIEDQIAKIESYLSFLTPYLKDMKDVDKNYVLNIVPDQIKKIRENLQNLTEEDGAEERKPVFGGGESPVINENPDPEEEAFVEEKTASIFELSKDKISSYDELYKIIKQELVEFKVEINIKGFSPLVEAFGGEALKNSGGLLNAFKYLSFLRETILRFAPSDDEIQRASPIDSQKWEKWFGTPSNRESGIVFVEITTLQENLVINTSQFRALNNLVAKVEIKPEIRNEYDSEPDLSGLIDFLNKVGGRLNTRSEIFNNFITNFVGTDYLQLNQVKNLITSEAAVKKTVEDNLKKHQEYKDFINNPLWIKFKTDVLMVVNNSGDLQYAFVMLPLRRNILLDGHKKLLEAKKIADDNGLLVDSGNSMIKKVVDPVVVLYDKGISGLEEKEVEEFEGRVEVRSYLSLLNRVVLDNGDINPVVKTLSLKELRSTKKQLIDLDIYKKYLSSAFGEDLKKYLLKVQTRLKTALDYLDGVTKETQEEKTRERNRKSVEALFIDTGVPLRKELEPVGEYLERIHPHLASLANGIVNNSIYDNAAEPYTLDYRSSPLRGPNKHMSIADHPLTHSKSLDLDVKNFDSLWDLFASTYEDSAERKLVSEYSERQKALHSEISLWHNRAVIRRSNESKAGPDAAFAGITQIFNEKKYNPDLSRVFSKKESLIEGERKQLEATEFCMSVWSAMHLSMGERMRLWNHISPRVKTFFQERIEDGETFYDVKPEFRQVPIYKGKPQQQLALVREIMRQAGEIIGNLPGDDGGEHKKRMAELAYSIGESYRIGFGMEAFFDVEYAKDAEGNSYAKVLAKEGEPKAAMVGLYAESTNMNTTRTNFNGAFATHVVRAYPSLSRVIQYNHNYQVAGLGFDISGLGDMRSSLAEILTIPGAIWDTDFSTTSSDPDKIIADIATEAQIFWTSSQISNVLEGKAMLLWSPKMQLEPTEIINQPNEYGPLARYFDPTKRMAQKISRGLKGFRSKVLRGPSLQEIEAFGFDSPHGIISQTEKDRLAGHIKHFVDYWIGGLAVDSKTYPMDAVRTFGWMFSRDDKPEHGFSVNSEVETIINNVRDAVVSGDDMKEFVNKEFLPNITAYMWHSFLLRATFYVMSPALTGKFRGLRLDQARINSLYEGLDRVTMQERSFRNMAGGIPVSTAEIARAINTAVLIRDLHPEWSEKFYDSGYRLVEGVDDEGVLAEHKIPFTRNAVLKIAQEYGMGDGFFYEIAEDHDGQSFYRLTSDNDPITLQHVANRIVLLYYLFDQTEFKKSKGG